MAGSPTDQVLEHPQPFLRLLAIDIHQMREVAFVPDHAEQGLLQFCAARAGGLPDGVDIGGVHLGVADDADSLDGVELLCREAKQTRLEVPGDAIVRDRALQAIPKKRIVQPVAPGAEAVQRHGV